MKYVRILHPWMPEYRETFFRKLIEIGIRDNIKYEIFAGSAPLDASNRGDAVGKTDFYYKITTTEIRLGNRSLVFHHLPKDWHKVDLVITEHAIRNLQVYRWASFWKPKKLAFWGHGKTYTKKNTFIEEWIKTNLVNRASWFFGYTELGVKLVIDNGFPEDNTTIVQNSTDTKKIKKAILKLDEDEVRCFREQFLLSDKNVAVFIGALDSSKRLDFLIDAAQIIQRAVPTFNLLIFGDGPDREKVLHSIKSIPHVKYCGRADSNLLALISKVSKLILMPGRVGLISVDSFALGIPIVTTDWNLHAPEFEYLENGFNALVTKDDLSDFSDTVIRLLNDSQTLEKLKKNCQSTSEMFSIEAMVSNFHKGVRNALGLKNRPTPNSEINHRK